MATITSLTGSDGITTANSMTKINTNFTNLNSDKIETSYLDTDTTLAANSDVKIPSQKAVKTYIDTGGGTNASETARGIVEEATDAEILAGTATGATGAKLFITPAKTRSSGLVKFGGTGADGALSITSGATNIDLGNAAVVIKNYTSISITGTGSLTFTNPHANGTVIILKSQGNVTITSSTNPAVDARSMGSTAGVAGAPTGGQAYFSYVSNGGTVGGASGSGAGTAYFSAVNGLGSYSYSVFSKDILIACGTGGGGGSTTSPNSNSGGGGGASLTNSGVAGSAGTSGTDGSGGGAGGVGGGAIIIECAGAYSASSTLNASGSNGSNGTANKGGGGGGGGGGMIVVLYNTLTSDTATYTVAGGTGGSPNGTGGAGGNGGAGASLRKLNTEFT